MWDKITYPFPNCNGVIEVWQYISNFIPHLTGHAITYTCLNLISSMLVNWASTWLYCLIINWCWIVTQLKQDKTSNMLQIDREILIWQYFLCSRRLGYAACSLKFMSKPCILFPGPPLLTWIAFNPSMDKLSFAKSSASWNYLNVPKLQRLDE